MFTSERLKKSLSLALIAGILLDPSVFAAPTLLPISLRQVAFEQKSLETAALSNVAWPFARFRLIPGRDRLAKQLGSLLAALRGHAQPDPPVFFEGNDHSKMFAFVIETLPRLVGKNVVKQATLIHIDFHPDTAETVSLNTKRNLPVVEGNVVGYLHDLKAYKEAWWVHPPKATYRDWDRYAFTKILSDPAELPATASPVILSIDFDAFGSREEGFLPLSETHRRIDALLEVLRERNYNIVGIFTTPSPAWTQRYIPEIRERLYAGLATLGVPVPGTVPFQAPTAKRSGAEKGRVYDAFSHWAEFQRERARPDIPSPNDLDLIQTRAATLRRGSRVLYLGFTNSKLPVIDTILGADVVVTDPHPETFGSLPIVTLASRVLRRVSGKMRWDSRRIDVFHLRKTALGLFDEVRLSNANLLSDHAQDFGDILRRITVLLKPRGLLVIDTNGLPEQEGSVRERMLAIAQDNGWVIPWEPEGQVFNERPTRLLRLKRDHPMPPSATQSKRTFRRILAAA